MKQVVITTYRDQVTIAEFSATTTSPGTLTVTSVQAATAVMSPAKVTLTSPPEMTLMSPATVPAGSVTAVTVSPETVPVMSQATSATSVSTAVTVGLPEQVITAGLTLMAIPAAAAGWLVDTVTTTVPQEKTLDTTDLDTTPSKVNSPVVNQILSLKHFNVSEFICPFLVCIFLWQLVAGQPKATDAK